MTEWKPVCRIEDIPRLGARRVQRAVGGAVAVFRTADGHEVGAYYAVVTKLP